MPQDDPENPAKPKVAEKLPDPPLQTPSALAAKIEERLDALHGRLVAGAEHVGWARDNFAALRAYYPRVETEAARDPAAAAFLQASKIPLTSLLYEVSRVSQEAEVALGAIDGITVSSFTICSTTAVHAFTLSASKLDGADVLSPLSDVPQPGEPVPVAVPTMRTDYETRLNRIDPSLGRVYAEAREALYATRADPIRGALFMLRQVFDHLFGVLSPEAEVRAHFSLSADDDVTRRHRIIYAAQHRIRDKNRAATLEGSATLLLDAYQELNRAHKRGVIDANVARPAMMSALRILEEWADALEV